MLSRFNREFARRAVHEGFPGEFADAAQGGGSRPKRLPSAQFSFSKRALHSYKEEIEFFGSLPSMYTGQVDCEARLLDELHTD
jgi:hypothetical protein